MTNKKMYLTKSEHEAMELPSTEEQIRLWNEIQGALRASSSDSERSEIKQANRLGWICPFCCISNPSIFEPCRCGAEVQLG